MIQFQFGMPLFLMGFYGGVMVLVVLAIRFLFGKWLPKRVIPVLWALVLVRLLVPFSVSSPLSLPVPGFLEDMWSGTAWTEYDQVVIADKGTMGFTYDDTNDTIPKEEASAEPNEELVFQVAPSEVQHLPAVFSQFEGTVALGGAPCYVSQLGMAGMGFGGIGLVGMAVTALVLCWRYFQSRRRFQGVYELEENSTVRQTLLGCGVNAKVYSCDTIQSPVVIGILQPAILLPASLDFENTRLVRHILTHEAMHVRRRDNLMKLVMMAALCIHWYNPLVWVMARELCRDLEPACDEAALAVMGQEESAPYAQSLLALAVPGMGAGLFASAFSRTEVERRIKGVLSYRKLGVMTLAAAAVVVLTSATAFATCGQTFFSSYLGDWCYGGGTYVAKAELTRPIQLGGSRDYARSRANRVVHEVVNDASDDIRVEALEKDIQKRLALEFGVEPGAFRVRIAPALDPEETAKQYKEYGLEKDKEGHWLADGKQVHVLEDQLAGEYYSNSQGEVDVYIIRDEQYKLLRVEKFDYYRY